MVDWKLRWLTNQVLVSQINTLYSLATPWKRNITGLEANININDLSN
jgi:hypothetical protein